MRHRPVSITKALVVFALAGCVQGPPPNAAACNEVFSQPSGLTRSLLDSAHATIVAEDRAIKVVLSEFPSDDVPPPWEFRFPTAGGRRGSDFDGDVQAKVVVGEAGAESVQLFTSDDALLFFAGNVDFVGARQEALFEPSVAEGGGPCTAAPGEGVFVGALLSGFDQSFVVRAGEDADADRLGTPFVVGVPWAFVDAEQNYTAWAYAWRH